MSQDRFRLLTYDPAELNEDGTKKRIKKNRWGAVSDNRAAGLMDLPFAITGNLTGEQLDAYGLNLRIEEISQKLRISDVVPPDGERSAVPILYTDKKADPPQGLPHPSLNMTTTVDV